MVRAPTPTAECELEQKAVIKIFDKEDKCVALPFLYLAMNKSTLVSSAQLPFSFYYQTIFTA